MEEETEPKRSEEAHGSDFSRGKGYRENHGSQCTVKRKMLKIADLKAFPFKVGMGRLSHLLFQ